MTVRLPGVQILDEEECWRLLRQSAVGRLAVDVGGRPDIYPVNHAVDGRSIVFRSGEGTKLAAAVVRRHVAFEIDGYEPDDRVAWSVVVRGEAEEVHGLDDIDDQRGVERLPLFPWVAFPKPYFVRITPDTVTGRRFHVLDHITPDSSLGWSESEVVEPGVAPRPGAEYHPGKPRLRPD